MKLSRTTRTSHVLTTTLTNQPSPTTQPNLTTQLITTYSPLIMQYVMYLVPTPCGVTAFVNYAAVSGVSFVPSFIVIMLLSSLSLSLPVLRSLSFSTLSTLLFSVQLAFLPQIPGTWVPPNSPLRIVFVQNVFHHTSTFNYVINELIALIAYHGTC